MYRLIKSLSYVILELSRAWSRPVRCQKSWTSFITFAITCTCIVWHWASFIKVNFRICNTIVLLSTSCDAITCLTKMCLWTKHNSQIVLKMLNRYRCYSNKHNNVYLHLSYKHLVQIVFSFSLKYTPIIYISSLF